MRTTQIKAICTSTGLLTGYAIAKQISAEVLPFTIIGGLLGTLAGEKLAIAQEEKEYRMIQEQKWQEFLEAMEEEELAIAQEKRRLKKRRKRR
jgi:hypothetical protein